MPDEGVRHTTLWAFTRTGKTKLELRSTYSWKGIQLGYNDHALQLGSKDAAKHDL